MEPGDILDVMYEPDTHTARYSFILLQNKENVQGFFFIIFIFNY